MYQHIVRIAAKRGDVVAHPLQGGDQIQLADVARVRETPVEVAQVAIA
jgi:hypothetical protein